VLITLAYALLWAAALAYALFARIGSRPAEWVATGTTLLSWGLLTAALVRRALAAGHWPLTNRYEFALAFVWAILVLYLLLAADWRGRRGEVYTRAGPVGVLGVALLLATYALFRPPEERAIAPLLPALRSAWFHLHVLSTLVGYGAFGVAAGLGLVGLAPGAAPEVGQPQAAELAAGAASDTNMPSRVEFERALDRALALGFPWLTLGILTGAIWAQSAWGRYWDWDPKETWALVTWLWYLLVLHLRPLRNWRGRRLAALVVIGFGLVLFTFVGVPWLVRTVRLESLHGF